MRKLALSAAVVAFAISGCTTSSHIAELSATHQGPMGFPELEQPSIPGAPKLGNPMLIMGETMPVQTAKHGLISPALWDWNGDGKRDLLLGEFETETKNLDENSSTIRVYLNVGTDSNPQFSDDWEYALDTEGNPIAVPQW